jgi:hypothetical protein
MSEAAYYENVGELALSLLTRQTFIPSCLVEERGGEACMCTGAAVLFAAHLVRGGERNIIDFFSVLATETEEDFVEKRSRLCGLDPIAVRGVIIVSKAIKECDRPGAVAEFLRAFIGNSLSCETRGKQLSPTEFCSSPDSFPA